MKYPRLAMARKKVRDQMKGNTMTKWDLDTENDGCDETGLVGTREEVIADVLCYHELKRWPAHWELLPREDDVDELTEDDSLGDWLDAWEQAYADGETRISRQELIRRWEQEQQRHFERELDQ